MSEGKSILPDGKRGKHKRDPFNFDTKWCPKCQQMVPMVDFYKSKGSFDGLAGHCKLCNKAAADQKKKNKNKFF